VKVINTLAYYDTALVTAVKSFILLPLGADVIKLFSLSMTHTLSKLARF
jgi:hypothetical protein